MSRIVIDARELRTSSGRYVECLVNYLQVLDTFNEYKLLVKPKDFGEWKPKGNNFEAVACPPKEFTFAEQISMEKQVSGLHADLVHFTFPQQPIRYKGKTVTTIHDLTTLRFTNPDKNKLVFKFKQAVYARVIKKAANKAEYVITPSQFVKDDLIGFTGINPNKIKVIYEAADPIADAADPLPGLIDKPFIMYVWRPTPHKNLERLIDAFLALKGSHPELTLVLAGQKDSNYERIENDVIRQAVRGVYFTGFVSEGRLRWLYENCSAYVFPSLSEGFGLPGLEAMLHGAPVVSSSATCLPEIYGEAAHYFDPTNVQDMSSAINEVLSNENMREKLVENGKVQAAKYSWHKTAQDTLQIYSRSFA